MPSGSGGGQLLRRKERGTYKNQGIPRSLGGITACHTTHFSSSKEAGGFTHKLAAWGCSVQFKHEAKKPM